jgi:hypothetical protein
VVGEILDSVVLPCNGLEKPTFMLKFECFKVGISTRKFISSINRPNSTIPDHRHSKSMDRPTLLGGLYVFFDRVVPY